MEIINDTALAIAYIAGRLPFPGHSLTIIVKGTYDMRPDRKATLSEEQPFPTGDEFYADDEEMRGAPRYASDFAYFKPGADLSLVGHCHAPPGALVSARQVAFQVGDVRSTLIVYGDRHWIGPLTSDPQPFSKMPLRYEFSYGGDAFGKNPVGRGYTKSMDEAGKPRRYLPNIMRPGEQMTTPLSRLEPAGFGPLHRQWDQRSARLGSYKGEYLGSRWPWFAEDMDWRYFNASPETLQTGFLRGDEKLCFENLHTQHTTYRCELPGYRIRCFAARERAVQQNADPFSEVSLNLDTLWVDMDAEKLVLVWRGWTQVLSEDVEEVRHLLIAAEPLEQAPESLAFYENLLQQRLREEEALWEEEEPPPQPAPAVEDDADSLIAAAETSYRKAMTEAGLDPDHPPEPSAEEKEKERRILKDLGFDTEEDAGPEITREFVINQFAATKRVSGLHLENLNLSGVDFSGGTFQGTVFANADLSGCIFDGADLTEAIFFNADLSESRFQNAVLTNADFSQAHCSRAIFTRAVLSDAICENADLKDARLENVDAAGASFIEADLSGASFAGAVLRNADLSASNLAKADFTGADLAEATLEDANGPGIVMDGADLTGLRASGGSVFSHGSFKNVSAPGAVWEAADLSNTDFSFSKMEGASFSKALLRGARMRAADMKSARFEKADLTDAHLVLANLLESSFERADLARCDCRGANMYGSEFLDARIEGARFEGANLKMTKLAVR